MNSSPAARGSQEAGITQPSLHLFLHVCILSTDDMNSKPAEYPGKILNVNSHPLHVAGPVDWVYAVVVAGAAVPVDVAGEREAARPAVGQLVLARVASHLR